MPRIQMLDGFNEGWIEFNDRGRNAARRKIDAATVISAFVGGTKA